jgi:hypothetical protein
MYIHTVVVNISALEVNTICIYIYISYIHISSYICTRTHTHTHTHAHTHHKEGHEDIRNEVSIDEDVELQRGHACTRVLEPVSNLV